MAIRGLITWQWAPDRGSARQVGKLLSLVCPGRTFVEIPLACTSFSLREPLAFDRARAPKRRAGESRPF
jgi:hypothetical protein